MKKILLIVCLIAIATGAFASDKSIEFCVFDIGQGDSLFFRLPDGETILIDGGPRDAGSTVVKNLHRLGVDKIDLLIATHPHEDHIGGLIDVLNAFPVGKVWDSGYNLGTATQRRFLEAIHRKNIPFSVPKAGFSDTMGEVSLDVVAPVRLLKTKNSEANNNSIVVRVSWREVSFLLMGDAEIEERKTVNRYPRSTVLKLAHHGSSDGTNQFLLRNVRPQIAIASYAKNNSYGHPHKEVLKLLKEHNVPFYSTINGDVMVTSDGNKISVQNEKSNSGSWWLR